MKKACLHENLLFLGFIALISFLINSCAAPVKETKPAAKKTVVKSAVIEREATLDDLIEGGKLYDKWWIEVSGVEEPKIDHGLWSLQSTNKREGSATWRCKECHGWDYLGKDGAYSKGSHKTGFPGVFQIRNKSIKDIEAMLLGSSNAQHNFSTVLDYDSIFKLAVFLKKGMVNLHEYIDYTAKKPFSFDVGRGEILFKNECSKCHGEDGRQLNFGTDVRPQYIGTVAVKNPWEFVHKVKFGQPGTIMPSLRAKLKLTEEENQMPSGIETGYTMEDIMSIIGYSRTLPKK